MVTDSVSLCVWCQVIVIRWWS